MKRGLLLGLVLTALLFGCGERTAEQAEATPAATVAPTATAQPTPSAEPVLLTMAPTEPPTPSPTARRPPALLAGAAAGHPGHGLLQARGLSPA